MSNTVRALAIAIGALIAGLYVLSCCSCKSPAVIAERLVYKANKKSDVGTARGCATLFPFRPTSVTTKSDTVTIHDTTAGQVIIVDCPDGTKKAVNCPPSTHSTSYIHDTTTRTVLDSAATLLYVNARDSAFKVAEKAKAAEQVAKDRLAKSERQKWITWIILALLILGTAAFKFFKPKL